MESLLLSAHVVAGILFVGPVALATSLFPRHAGAEVAQGAHLLHRVTRTYGVLALAVPAVGLLLAGLQGRTGEVWVVVAMVLTALAGGLLALQVVPRQRDALAGDLSGLRGLTMLTGVFNLLWAAVVVLMIVRPGSAT